MTKLEVEIISKALSECREKIIESFTNANREIDILYEQSQWSGDNNAGLQKGEGEER